MEYKKFEKYNCLIDCYSKDKSKYLYNVEEQPEDYALFSLERPIEISVLMKYLDFIIEQMYIDLGSKEKVEKAIERIKNEKARNIKTYSWNDISIEDLFNADIDLLKKIFVLRRDLVHDENSFINNYSRPDFDFKWNFSLKEIYFYFLQRGIEICIDNYSNHKKQ